jgi:hypothetical protein
MRLAIKDKIIEDDGKLKAERTYLVAEALRK